MARKNAEQLAEEARERLRISNEKQQEIALQAIESIENGADPKLVMMIAEEAAKSVSSRPVMAAQHAPLVNQLSPEEEEIQHIKWTQETIPSFSDVSSERFELLERHPSNDKLIAFSVVNHDPIALPKYAVDYLIEKYPNHFARVEEN